MIKDIFSFYKLAPSLLKKNLENEITLSSAESKHATKVLRKKEGDINPSLYCAVIVKRVDEKTRSKTSINDLLRD